MDEAILKLVDQASESQKLCQQVEDAIAGTNNPRTAFTQWMGAEVSNLPAHLWNKFQRDAFELVMRYKEMDTLQPLQSSQIDQHILSQNGAQYQFPGQFNQGASSTPIPTIQIPTLNGTHQPSLFQNQGLLTSTQGYPIGVTPILQYTGQDLMNISGLLSGATNDAIE